MTMDEMKVKYVQWFSGFYEGEGCICNDISNNNKLRTSIAQNDNTPLILGQSIWGGTIRKRVRKSPLSEKICTGYEWRMSHNESVLFINDIKPFMLIFYKIKQVEDAFVKAKEGLSRRFKCPTCDKDYASPAGRRRHVKMEHLK
jgi:hypothetical protein